MALFQCKRSWVIFYFLTSAEPLLTLHLLLLVFASSNQCPSHYTSTSARPGANSGTCEREHTVTLISLVSIGSVASGILTTVFSGRQYVFQTHQTAPIPLHTSIFSHLVIAVKVEDGLMLFFHLMASLQIDFVCVVQNFSVSPQSSGPISCIEKGLPYIYNPKYTDQIM